jgi:hypothetical protein
VQAKEKREEGKGKTEADEWALPSSERGKKKGKGLVAGLLWPARLLGRRGYWARNRFFARPAQ